MVLLRAFGKVKVLNLVGNNCKLRFHVHILNFCHYQLNVHCAPIEIKYSYSGVSLTLVLLHKERERYSGHYQWYIRYYKHEKY